VATNFLSKHRLVAVIWDDAHHSLEEFSQEEAERDFHGAAREINYGLLVKRDDKGITLAMEEGDGDGNFRHLFFIPSAMVIEVVDLGRPSRRVARKPRQKAPKSSKAPAPVRSQSDLSPLDAGQGRGLPAPLDLSPQEPHRRERDEGGEV